MNAIGASILVALVLTILFAPRRWALLGMMAGVLFLTQGQKLEVFGFNLYAVRFVELAGFIRIMARREFSFAELTSIDRALLLLYVYTTVVVLLRSPEGQASQIGLAVDALLCYFTFRGLLGGVEDLRWFLRAFLLLLAPYVALVLIERLTKQNPFSSMGGVVCSDWLREGRLRCQGSFRHPSLLGTLGGSFLPLYIGLAFAKAGRKFAWIGIGLCLLIIWASNSGGPANCAAVALVGWMLWRVRTKMRLLRWMLAAGIAALAIVMKAPVWYLIDRVSSLTGGDGWHRSYLLDVAFQNLGKWWFVGMPVEKTSGWFADDLAATGGADITNQFISFGLAAGLIAMALFIVLLVLALRNVGKALAAVRSGGREPNTEYLLWGLGVMLVVHIANWLGITYFDQTYVIWFMQLAAVSNLSERLIHSAPIAAVGDAHDPWEVNEDRRVVA